MKKIFIILIVLISTVTSHAQSDTLENSGIEKVILNYIENFFENDYDAMNESLHPRLAKR